MRAKDIDQLALALWCVLSSVDFDQPLAIANDVLPGISASTSRIAFVEQFAVEFVSLIPIHGASVESFTDDTVSHQAVQHRFEEFLVGMILFHLIEETGAWLSMSVALAKLFRFFDALLISDQESVCRDLLRAMVDVDGAAMSNRGTPSDLGKADVQWRSARESQ